jgi:hypothetical protein
VQLTVTGDKEIIADFKEKPQAVTRALVRALNRSILAGNTLMARLIAADTGLKQSDVKAAMRKADATISRPSAAIFASLKRIPLIKFGARGPEPSRGKGGGVSYRLKGGRGRIREAFIATMRSGHRGVFVRVPGARRLPIDEKFGPSIGHVFGKHRPQGIQKVLDVFDKNMAHELNFAKSKAADAGAD